MAKTKDFKTVTEQLVILQQRGLTFGDEERIKRYLLTNNYYNIINGYSKFFQEEKSNLYRKDVTFDEIATLYFFDRELKITLLNAILNAEHHLKSIFAYRFAEKHKNEKYAYLNFTSYDEKNSVQVSKIILRLSQLIKRKTNRRKSTANNAIDFYVKRHNDVPIWVLIDFIDFGTLCELIEIVPTSMQNKIAKDLNSFISENLNQDVNMFEPEVMVSFIKNIHEIRNICAHNNRLLGYECRADSKYFEQLCCHYNIAVKDQRRSVYSVFLNLQCFLSRTEFCILNNTVRKRCKYLGSKINSIDSNEILSSIGFPKNWEKQPKLIQN
ncbi:Abi family protein [Lactobacillus sp. ESL0731]|uniref:Abi family protein n=1 Tax=unclassified Lactobacillus TaxID=2620435 RepID=UPI0023F8E6FA|nr:MULTISPECIES: Abi family protein [unclassified Lactobacillus]WEV50417.1 Abi family protein [Lactobacillus sp. ESL0700]WEV61547.1 Abi family protein [Lactobacillus sp. ESL0731]